MRCPMINIRKIITGILGGCLLLTSTLTFANEPTIEWGDRTFTRQQFIDAHPNGWSLPDGSRVTADVVFDTNLQADNADRERQQREQERLEQERLVEKQRLARLQAIEDGYIKPVIFDEPTLLTSDELLELQETAFTYLETRSTITLPNRRLTEEELQAWIDEYKKLGGTNGFELEVVRLINEVRESYGLSPLYIDPALMFSARFKVQEWSTLGAGTNASGTLNPHYSPVYGHFTNIPRLLFGATSVTNENLASASLSPEIVVNGWLNSDGHRRNLLNPNTTKMGVGVYEGVAFISG